MRTIVKQILATFGLPAQPFTVKRVSFMDLARGTAYAVTITDWTAGTVAEQIEAAIKAQAREHGDRAIVSFRGAGIVG